MADSNITFVVFTFNEEHRIEYVLRCFKDYGHILIVDNFSTDRTVEIAKRYNAEVFQRKNTKGWAEEETEVKNILDKVSTDWVYWGYADELLPKTLLEKFVEISKQNKYKVVYFRRRNVHYGAEDLYLENAIQSRFFVRGSIDFKDNRIHSFGKIVCLPDKILHLPLVDEYSQYHFSAYNIEKFEKSHSGYSSVEAKRYVDDGNKFSLLKILLKPVFVFTKYYIVNGGWKSGMRGFIMAMQYAFFTFNIEAKIWENENDITIESIEHEYSKLKEEMLGR